MRKVKGIHYHADVGSVGEGDVPGLDTVADDDDYFRDTQNWDTKGEQILPLHAVVEQSEDGEAGPNNANNVSNYSDEIWVNIRS